MLARPIIVHPITVVPRQEQNVQINNGFKNYGDGADIAIASQNNGANKNINLNGGFTSMGNGAKIQIGLQNLNTETNAYGVRTTEIGR